MKTIWNIVKNLFNIVVLVLMIIGAPFYLFVVPMLAANGSTGSEPFGLIFGAFMLFQLFLAVFLYTYEAMVPVYNLPRSIFFGSTIYRKGAKRVGSKNSYTTQVVILSPILVMFAYPMFVYAFAVLYVYLSHLDPFSFNSGTVLPGFDAFYFSLVTSTTVGYGDIAPVSKFAKSVVICQIFLNLIYAVLVFSALSTYLRSSRESKGYTDPEG